MVYPETARLGPVTALTPAGELVETEATEFTLAARAVVTVTAVDESPLAGLARAAVEDAVEEGRTLFPDSVEVEVTPGRAAGERVRYEVSAVGRDWGPADADRLLAEVRGKPVEEARALLEPYGDVEIDLWPDFIGSIPTMEGRVTLTVVPPDRSAS